MAPKRQTDARAPRRLSRVASRLLVAAALLGGLLVAAPARADGGLFEIDWSKLASGLRDGAGMPQLHDPLRSDPEGQAPASALKWFGLTSHVSLVARDWGTAQLLLGHLALTDQIRLSRSSRMVIGRFRLADGRITPFVQLGLGQWRVDTDVMPVYRRDVELAGQMSAGFELTLTRYAMIALETDETVLYREQHEPQMVNNPHQWGTFLAARAVF
jgi:hypothetical protein